MYPLPTLEVTERPWQEAGFVIYLSTDTKQSSVIVALGLWSFAGQFTTIIDMPCISTQSEVVDPVAYLSGEPKQG